MSSKYYVVSSKYGGKKLLSNKKYEHKFLYRFR